MKNIVIIGAGVMGSALAVPAADCSTNNVTLVGSVLDDDIIKTVQSNRHHPTLDIAIPTTIDAITLDALDDATLRSADIIVLGVSSAGIGWAMDYLKKRDITPAVLALVTKGLVRADRDDSAPLTYADVLDATMTNPAAQIVGIGGPCIARELALKIPTRVTFAARDERIAQQMRHVFQTPYYRITTHEDIVALEACAALKNFLCIGVSAMFSAYPLDDSYAKNPIAALYNQAVRELYLLSEWISDSSPGHQRTRLQHQQYQHVAFDLAGMGDMHVTVGGGRNSRLGKYLGTGKRISEVINGPMKGITVEGVDTGRNLLHGFRSACEQGQLEISQLPLTDTLLTCISNDSLFSFDFQQLPD